MNTLRTLHAYLGEPAARWTLWGAFPPEELRREHYGPLPIYCRREPNSTAVRVYVPTAWLGMLHHVHNELRLEAALVVRVMWPPTPVGALRAAARTGLTLAAMRLVNTEPGGVIALVRAMAAEP